MTKTERDIEDDFYFMVKSSELPGMIQGKLYKKDDRPFNSKTEDIVVGFLSGLDGQTQEGYVNINVFVPNISVGSTDGKKRPNKARIKVIQSKLLEFTDNIIDSNSEYDVERDSTIQTFETEDLEQVMVNAKLYYKRTTL